MNNEEKIYKGFFWEFSAFAQFHIACKGYYFLLNGEEVSRSLLFYNGFIDANRLINNKTRVVAVARPEVNIDLYRNN